MGAAGAATLALAPLLRAGRSRYLGADAHGHEYPPVGYAPQPEPGVSSPVVEASSLASGDTGFHETGALVKVRGFCDSAGSTTLDAIERLSLDVSFEPFHDVLFHAWYFNRAAQSSGSPIAVPVPVDRAHGLKLVLEMTRAGDPGPLTRTITLSTGDEVDALKLRHGHYFISLQAPDEDAPDWSRYLVQHDSLAADDACLAQADANGAGQTLNAPMIVLSVQHPSEAS